MIPNSQEDQKLVFFVLYPAQEETYLDRKISRIVQNFSDKDYEFP